ncbi:MAG: hypothetical protein JXR03_15355 [Cyclobacteriaceae bacterium]
MALITSNSTCLAQEINALEKNEMIMKWSHAKRHIQFEIEAPTKGWVAIGFNQSSKLSGTYLIMGAVKGSKVIIKEHYVFEPGDYRSFDEIGIESNLKNIDGIQSSSKTTIRFSLPNDLMTRYTQLLSKDATFNILMAYSSSDDFTHHSMMRTNVNFKL